MLRVTVQTNTYFINHPQVKAVACIGGCLVKRAFASSISVTLVWTDRQGSRKLSLAGTMLTPTIDFRGSSKLFEGLIASRLTGIRGPCLRLMSDLTLERRVGPLFVVVCWHHRCVVVVGQVCGWTHCDTSSYYSLLSSAVHYSVWFYFTMFTMWFFDLGSQIKIYRFAVVGK